MQLRVVGQPGIRVGKVVSLLSDIESKGLLDYATASVAVRARQRVKAEDQR
jgi:hypothetical protein